MGGRAIWLIFLVLTVAGFEACSSGPGEDRPLADAGTESQPAVEGSSAAVPNETRPGGPHPALLAPELAHAEAPDQFRIHFDTTQGPFVVEVVRDWAPRGADRLYSLVQIGFFDDAAFFRAIPGFIVQFGLHGEPGINQLWASTTIQDDPVATSNLRGTLSFAQSGPNGRTTQLFVNLSDNTSLDAQGLAPVGKVVEGLSVLDSIYSGYGELGPKGKGPRPRMMNEVGNKYLRRQFPKLDYVVTASLDRE